jgi:mannosyl-3-phosphoglycerate phosphatase
MYHNGERPQAVVFSDLDGTLLDHDTYSWEPAREAMEELRRRTIPLILVTSKTRAEVEPIREALGNDDPFLVENGGGIFVPVTSVPASILLPSEPLLNAEREGDYFLIRLGSRYEELTAALAHAIESTGIRAKGFHQMPVEEVRERTGLSEDEAARAKQREFGEPFVVEPDQDAEPLLRAIEAAGFRWTKGGRFYHVLGANDKGRAVRLLIDAFNAESSGTNTKTAGLGDGLNDLDFLLEVDVPILIPSGQTDQMHTRIPHAHIAPEKGPAGWNRAILDWLKGF